MSDDCFRTSRKSPRGAGIDDKKSWRSKNPSINRSIPDARCNEVSRLLSKMDLTVFEDISLRSQRLSCLPENFATRLFHLKSLDLSDNDLRRLPRSIKFLVKLKHLRLNDNRLWCLPPVVTKLCSLVTLELANNYVTRLPHNLTELRNLEILLIGRNCLSELPASCDDMNVLRELDISDNRIERLGNFSNLVRLNVARNELHRLPHEICRLAKLQVLDVQGNSLTELPDEIGGMVNLRELRANSNRLVGLPDSAQRLAELTYLDLYDNDLYEMPRALRHMGKLVGLDIDGNPVDVDNFLIGGIEYKKLRKSLRNRYRSEEYTRETGRKHEEPKIADEWKTRNVFFANDSNERREKTRENGEDEIEENWDVSDDSADEYDPTCDIGDATRKSSVKYSYLEAISWSRPIFCPANFHPPTIKQQMIEKNGLLQTQTKTHVEEGQFEDA